MRLRSRHRQRLVDWLPQCVTCNAIHLRIPKPEDSHLRFVRSIWIILHLMFLRSTKIVISWQFRDQIISLSSDPFYWTSASYHVHTMLSKSQFNSVLPRWSCLHPLSSPLQMGTLTVSLKIVQLQRIPEFQEVIAVSNEFLVKIRIYAFYLPNHENMVFRNQIIRSLPVATTR